MRYCAFALVFMVLVACGDLDAGSGGEEAAGEAAGETGDGQGAGDKARAKAKQRAKPASLGDGTHVVGKDVKPGTYRSTGEGMCYWARLKGFSGELDDVGANGNNAPEIVTLTKKDKGFETQGCGDWLAVKQTAPKQPAVAFGDGTYQVGVHLKPGTYRSDGSEMCYWARLKDFTHDLNGIIANGNNAGVVEIAGGDAGFSTFGCGEWSRM